MSAQAVLSMIAPAVPATPQGSSDTNATAFQGLLAAMLATGAATEDASGASPKGVPAPEVVPPEDENAAAEASGLPGLLTGPLPVAPEPAPPPAGSAPPVAGEAAASGQPIEPIAPQVADVATSPVPAETSAPKGVGPLVPPDVGEKAVLPVSPPVAEDDGAATASSSAGDAPAATESKTQAAVGAQPAPAPGTTAPAPPPLRALAERTSRPLDEPTKPAVGVEPADARAAGSAAEPGTQASAQPAKPPVPAAAASLAPDATAPASSETAPAEAAAPAADTAAPVREHALSTLSRTTIDATAQIAAQILRKLEGRSTRFEIALRPDELGRVDVKLDIDSEGRLAARLAFDNPAAATDLRGRVDDLRRQLENAGFQLADDAFEFAERDSGSSAFDRGQDSSRGQNRAFAAAARLNNEIDVALPPRWMALTLSPTGVDMKV